MEDNPVMADIQRLSNRRYALYRELDHIIESGGLHLGSAQPQTIEIKEIEGQLMQLWAEERARGKFWLPRLRKSKRR